MKNHKPVCIEIPISTVDIGLDGIANYQPLIDAGIVRHKEKYRLTDAIKGLETKLVISHTECDSGYDYHSSCSFYCNIVVTGWYPMTPTEIETEKARLEKQKVDRQKYKERTAKAKAKAAEQQKERDLKTLQRLIKANPEILKEIES